MKKYILLFSFILALGICTLQAQYAIKSSVIGIGGQTTTDSMNYQLLGTAGQSFIGQTENTANITKTGFWYISGNVLSGMQNPFDNLPKKFELHQNYPNPFNPVTTIKYDLPYAAKVRIDVYNILGQRVLTLLDENKPAGFHSVKLIGNHLATGMYFYTITADQFYKIKRMLLVK
jgi:hypothetical protein